MKSYHCRTNLDEAHFKKWPEDFVICPRVGDYVCADDGYRLKVVAITHKLHSHQIDPRQTPYIEIELHR